MVQLSPTFLQGCTRLGRGGSKLRSASPSFAFFFSSSVAFASNVLRLPAFQKCTFDASLRRSPRIGSLSAFILRKEKGNEDGDESNVKSPRCCQKTASPRWTSLIFNHHLLKLKMSRRILSIGRPFSTEANKVLDELAASDAAGEFSSNDFLSLTSVPFFSSLFLFLRADVSPFVGLGR